MKAPSNSLTDLTKEGKEEMETFPHTHNHNEREPNTENHFVNHLSAMCCKLSKRIQFIGVESVKAFIG